jgi:monoamine oxidase
MHIVVVGAGLAGMRAALVLREAGVDVTVIEGGDRPGGRVRTITAPFIDGQYSESGAEWVDTVHHRMLALMDRYGVPLLGSGERWTVIRRWLHRNGELLSPQRVREVEPTIDRELEAFEAIVDAAAEGIVDPSRPDLHPDALALDHRSLADLAEEASLGELAALFKCRDAQGEFAAEPSQVSLLFVAQQRAHQRAISGGAEVSAHRAGGGFSRVALGMAAELGSVVSFGEHLVAVAQDDSGVSVRTDRRSLAADHVVLACSLAPLRRVGLQPAPPAALRRAIDELGYGTVTKTSVQWSARQWPAGYATTAGRAQRVYEPTIDQPGEPGILTSYCGGEGGHEWARLDEAARVALATAEMRAMHGLTTSALGGYSRAWSNEPRYGGSYAVYEPGQVTAFWQVLREPWGRVHLAGEHVATCTGYMEGALESGDTTAARLLAAG